MGEDSDRFLGHYWSSGGAGGCRVNLRNKGTLILHTPRIPDLIRARFTFRPRRREGKERDLGVRLKCNGQRVGEARFSRPQPEEFTFLIPAGQAANGRLRLEFQFMNHGGGKWSVANAFCLMAMELEPVTND